MNVPLVNRQLDPEPRGVDPNLAAVGAPGDLMDERSEQSADPLDGRLEPGAGFFERASVLHAKIDERHICLIRMRFRDDSHCHAGCAALSCKFSSASAFDGGN